MTGAEAVRLMQAIKQRYPGIRAGEVIDPYAAAAGAWLNPDDPAYRVALRELEEAEVLREVPYDHVSATLMGMNPHYEVTPAGAWRIRDA